MNVVYRAPKEEEIPEAADVFITAVTALAERLSLPVATMPRESFIAAYTQILRTGIFEVAELEGKIVAVCSSIVRENQWFLCAFWTLPDLRQRHLGGPMLRRSIEEGKKRGAEYFFTWSSADPTAMAAYMKNGMLPGTQILTFAGAPSKKTASRAELSPLVPEELADFDREVRGAARTIDHQFFVATSAAAYAVKIAGRRAGYFYATRGSIGPAAWANDADAEVILSAALEVASAQAPEVRLAIPGPNHRAIRFVFEHGLRFFWFAHLLTTKPFGAMDRYIPSGPSFF